MAKVELQEWQVKNLRNYFGKNSKTGTEHWAYEIFNNAVKKQCDAPIISGGYYWVKRFEDREYEPAKAKERYGNMYFCFTDGSVRECKYVSDYKELRYH